jgi:hypothetical protein
MISAADSATFQFHRKSETQITHVPVTDPPLSLAEQPFSVSQLISWTWCASLVVAGSRLSYMYASRSSIWRIVLSRLRRRTWVMKQSLTSAIPQLARSSDQDERLVARRGSSLLHSTPPVIFLQQYRNSECPVLTIEVSWKLNSQQTSSADPP